MTTPILYKGVTEATASSVAHSLVFPVGYPTGARAYLLIDSDSSGSPAAPAGWTLVANANNNSNEADLFSKDALTVASEANVAITSSQDSVGRILVVENSLALVTPLATIDNTTGNATISCPDENAVGSADLLVIRWAHIANGTLAISTYAAADNQENYNTGGTGGQHVSVGFSSEAVAGGVDVGTADYTFAGTNRMVAWTLVFEDDGTGGGGTVLPLFENLYRQMKG